MYDDDYNYEYNHSKYPKYSNDKNDKGKGGRRALKVLLSIIIVIAICAASIGGYVLLTSPGSGSANNAPAPSASDESGVLANSGQTASPAPSAQPSKDASDDETPALNTNSSQGLNQMSAEAVAQKLIPSVVCIQNYIKVTANSQQQFGWQAQFWGSQNQAQNQNENATIQLASEGSGIIISQDGYIITNAHVVNKSDLIKIVTSDGQVYEATLVGIDNDTDLAVIKTNATGLSPAEIGNSEELNVGQTVMAIGNPGGLEFSSSVTLGIVSAIDRPLASENGGYTMNTIQTDAAINPGNSGGALVNMAGQVVGICSAKYVATGYEGLGFAITIKEALPIVEDLITYGQVQNRSILGISGVMLDSFTAQYYELKEGFYVSIVSNKNAGDLAPGDIITEIDGTKVDSESVIKNALLNKAPGTQVIVKYYRSSDNQEHTTKITLLSASSSSSANAAQQTQAPQAQ